MTTVDLVLPVRNGASYLRNSLERLTQWRDARADRSQWLLTISVNGADGATEQIASEWSERTPDSRLLVNTIGGKGRAIRSAWQTSSADVLAYTDADLSLELSDLTLVVAPVLSGRADLTLGVRRDVTTPPLARRWASVLYRTAVRTTLGISSSDPQAGVKAISRQLATSGLLDRIEDNGWFFDTELVLLAERNSIAITEVEVRWRHKEPSTVALGRTGLQAIRTLNRLRRLDEPNSRAL